MARKPSREELEKRLNEVSLERDLLQRVVSEVMDVSVANAMFVGEDDIEVAEIETETGDSDVYTFKLFDATGPLAGIVVVTFESGTVRQKPSTSVHPLDTYYDGLLRAAPGDLKGESHELLVAVGKLKRRRNILIEDEARAANARANR